MCPRSCFRLETPVTEPFELLAGKGCFGLRNGDDALITGQSHATVASGSFCGTSDPSENRFTRSILQRTEPLVRLEKDSTDL